MLTDENFLLIKALSKNEKGYFKKSVSGNSGKIYLRLFDLLNGMETYDDALLLKMWKQKKIGTNITVAKQYLYEHILKSLRAYHAARFYETQSDENLVNLRLLMEKGQYDTCSRLLKKAKLFAQKYQHYPQLLSLLSFEYSFNQSQLRDSAYVFEEEAEVLEQLAQANRVFRVYNALLMLVVRHDKARTVDEQALAAAIIDVPAMKNEQEIKGFRAKATFLGTYFLYYYFIGDEDRAVQYKIRQLENYLDHPEIREANGDTFLLVLGNLLSILYQLGRKEEFNHYYALMQLEHRQMKRYTSLRNEQNWSLGLIYFKLNRLDEEGLSFIRAQAKEVLDNRNRLSLIRFSDFCFNACTICFRCGDTHGALQWLNVLLNDPRIEERQYVHCSARMVQLLLHTELENTELVENLVKSTHRYLYKRNRVFLFESLFLRYLKLISRNYFDLPKRTLLFEELKQETLLLLTDSQQKGALEHFDYVGWFDRQLSISPRKSKTPGTLVSGASRN